MLTPHDLEVRTFSKRMRGYDAAEVNEFMQLISEDFEKVYKENIVLKQKITVLVDKIEEYKKLEESLRNALISAQKMGETMIREAQTKGEILLSEANLKAERAMGNLNMQIYKQRQRLDETQQDYLAFRARLTALYQAQITLLNSMSLAEPPQELALPKEERAKEEQRTAAESGPTAEEPKAQAEEAAEQTAEKTFDFDAIFSDDVPV